MSCDIKVCFVKDVKGFRRFYYGKEITSFFPINYVPILEALLSLLIKPSTDYNFVFEEKHPFGAFERNSSLKIPRCKIEIKNNSFCIREEINLEEEEIKYSDVNRNLDVTSFIDIDEFIKYLAREAKCLLEKQYYEYNFLNNNYSCEFTFNFEIEEVVFHPFFDD